MHTGIRTVDRYGCVLIIGHKMQRAEMHYRDRQQDTEENLWMRDCKTGYRISKETLIMYKHH
jgi:hypothetical protein